MSEEIKLLDELCKKERYDLALPLAKKLADQGNAKAQCHLGNMYAYGRGTTLDYKEAVKWYQLSAGHGRPCAQFNLGISYRYGHGVDYDKMEALKWFMQSLEKYPDKAFVMGEINEIMTQEILTNILITKVQLERQAKLDKETIDELKDKVEQLETEINYRPGGSGYTQAKEHFEIVATM